ncbi:MAG: hypothetical protein FWF66_01200 [Candidatus Bathyarchaeota archaeon]|nr:hypothetical protein [Candidatus Termiticorpusculum sp.]
MVSSAKYYVPSTGTELPVVPLALYVTVKSPSSSTYALACVHCATGVTSESGIVN